MVFSRQIKALCRVPVGRLQKKKSIVEGPRFFFSFLDNDLDVTLAVAGAAIVAGRGDDLAVPALTTGRASGRSEALNAAYGSEIILIVIAENINDRSEVTAKRLVFPG